MEAGPAKKPKPLNNWFAPGRFCEAGLCCKCCFPGVECGFGPITFVLNCCNFIVCPWCWCDPVFGSEPDFKRNTCAWRGPGDVKCCCCVGCEENGARLEFVPPARHDNESCCCCSENEANYEYVPTALYDKMLPDMSNMSAPGVQCMGTRQSAGPHTSMQVPAVVTQMRQ